MPKPLAMNPRFENNEAAVNWDEIAEIVADADARLAAAIAKLIRQKNDLFFTARSPQPERPASAGLFCSPRIRA